MINLLGFYTQGDEVDGCFDLTECVKSIENNLNQYFDKIIFINKTELKKLPNSEDICNIYDEPLNYYNGMVINQHANKIGYFDFKPFIIDYALNNLIPDGEILLYHDLNFEKCQQYWESDWVNIRNICERVLVDNNTDFFCKFEHDGAFVRQFVKTHTIDQFFTNQTENTIVRNSKLFGAGQLVMRNTEFTRNLVSEWLNYCKDKKLIGPNPNLNADDKFQWGCGDQDVLNCLIYKYILEGKLNSDFPKYSFKYRVFRMENRPFNWPGQNWNPHPTGVDYIRNTELINYINSR